MSDDVVYAVFEPTEPQLLSTFPQAQLLVENPLLASALSNIFPYLLIIDDFLEVITWTNGDPYFNFLIVVAYSVLILYWGFFKFWALPLLSALVFASIVWHTSSVLYDAKFNEKPTIDEVLSVLHNITVRFELILRPAKHLDISFRNYINMILGAALLTPVHLILVKYVLSLQTVLWAVGVITLTYHSPYAFAVRRLLWRSAYLRRALYYLTGLSIRLSRDKYTSSASRSHGTIPRTHSLDPTDVEDKPCSKSVPILDSTQTSNNFTVVKKVVISSTQLKHIIRYDILENERRWLGLGWSKYLLPKERASFCYEHSMLSAPDPHSTVDFEFPVYKNDLYTYQWQWMDDAWSLDLEFNRSKYKTGWVYYDKKWSEPKYEDSFSRYTRTRKWTRRAMLLIDKQAEVHDE